MKSMIMHDESKFGQSILQFGISDYLQVHIRRIRGTTEEGPSGSLNRASPALIHRLK